MCKLNSIFLLYIIIHKNPMNNKTLTIKVSDLLNTIWKTDSILFENVFLKQITNLDEKWISWEICLQSINDSSILAKLKNVKCKTQETCDICNNKYEVTYKNIDYDGKFQIKETIPEYNDEIFPIDNKWVIDVEDFIVQSVVLNESFSKICPKCEDKQREDINDSIYDDFDGGANVNFSFKK